MYFSILGLCFIFFAFDSMSNMIINRIVGSIRNVFIALIEESMFDVCNRPNSAPVIRSIIPDDISIAVLWFFIFVSFIILLIFCMSVGFGL